MPAFFSDVEHLVMMPHQGGCAGHGSQRLFRPEVTCTVSAFVRKRFAIGLGWQFRVPTFFDDVKHLVLASGWLYCATVSSGGRVDQGAQ